MYLYQYIINRNSFYSYEQSFSYFMRPRDAPVELSPDISKNKCIAYCFFKTKNCVQKFMERVGIHVGILGAVSFINRD